MTVDPRQPVLVGVGRITHREGDAPEPAELMAEAIRRAAADSGGRGVLDAVRSVRVLNLLSRRYPDPGALVADRLGITVPHTLYTTQGGQTTQQVVDRACDEISTGKVDVVVVTGGESWRTRSRIKRRGESSPWSTQPDEVRPTEMFGTELVMTSPEEEKLGFADPVQAYPMIEVALAGRHGRTIDEQVRIASDVWARCSEVAAGNEHAMIRTAYTAEQIRTPTADNRMIGYPYTKLMNSNSSIDQAAALLLCSAERAEALGIAKDRWVFLHGAGEGFDVPLMSNRFDLSVSPAIAAAGRAAYELAGVGPDDIGHVDLYSCFPSAVEVAAEMLGLGLDRDLTVTGGNTFSGGPWNAYVVQSLAGMGERLRADPDAYGLVSANGGFLGKHAVGVWSCRPPAAGTRWRSVQPELDATVAQREAAPHHEGDATLETFTVMHDREGAPEQAFAFALTADGRRTLATSRDAGLLHTLEHDDVLGHAVAVRDGDLLEIH